MYYRAVTFSLISLHPYAKYIYRWILGIFLYDVLRISLCMNQDGSIVKPVDVLEILWKTLKDNYPMMEYTGVLDDSWLEDTG